MPAGLLVHRVMGTDALVRVRVGSERRNLGTAKTRRSLYARSARVGGGFSPGQASREGDGAESRVAGEMEGQLRPRVGLWAGFAVSGGGTEESARHRSAAAFGNT